MIVSTVESAPASASAPILLAPSMRCPVLSNIKIEAAQKHKSPRDSTQYAVRMAQAVRVLDCPWSDVTRLVLEVAPCR